MKKGVVRVIAFALAGLMILSGIATILLAF